MDARERGFTLVETVAASAVLTIGTLGLLATVAGTIQMDAESADSVVAIRAAQAKLDDIWSMATRDFEQVYPTYAGTTFAVDRLIATAGRPAVGEVILYRNEATAKAALELSNDLDIDRNGVASENVEKDPAKLKLLPVRIRLEWRTPFGKRRHDLETIIYNREVP